jgi:hypothetical protein
LNTAARLEELPATAEAFCAGRLSEAQVKEIGAAVEADPGAEGLLVATARSGSLRTLGSVAAGSAPLLLATRTPICERVGASRYGSGSPTPTAPAALTCASPPSPAHTYAALEPRATQLFEEARPAGRCESPAA